VVDSVLVAAKIAAVRDATARIGAVLPDSVDRFVADRTAREVVNWLADAGWEVPGTHGEVFAALARHDIIPPALAARLGAAAAFRNLVAHQYGVLDWRRVHALASSDLGDLETFCATLARRASGSG
jgi:uncharacterized protein YutE (UPF0331/DUF86 family)